MNGTNFLADTNALIYLLNGNQCMSNYLQKNLYVSVISEMELLSYSGITPDEEMQIKSFLNDCNEVTLTNEIKDKTILVIDDVFTTGSTLSECAKVLKKKGANKVKTLTFAKTRQNMIKTS